MALYRSYREYSTAELQRVYEAFVMAGGNPVGLERFREIGLALEALPLFSEEAERLHAEVGSDMIGERLAISLERSLLHMEPQGRTLPWAGSA
jgi:hypothetical protein